MSNKYDLIGYCSYRDNETGKISDNFVGVLNEQDQKIKDLEAKLKEKEKELQEVMGSVVGQALKKQSTNKSLNSKEISSMNCKQCGMEMICDETKILTSFPPKKEYKCPKCGNVEYQELYAEIKLVTETQKGCLQGWACPKCGAVMSPFQNTCPICTPPQKLEIHC